MSAMPHTDTNIQIDPDEYDFAGENPVKLWAEEVVPVHGDVTMEDRFEQVEELIARLRASTTLPTDERLILAGESLSTHDSMLDNIAFESDSISESDVRYVQNAMERLVFGWAMEPDQIEGGVDEYADELAELKSRLH